MSRRVLKLDPLEKRIEAYKELSSNEQQEMIWEAFEALQKQDLKLGPKATAYLEKRASIKRNTPKGNQS